MDDALPIYVPQDAIELIRRGRVARGIGGLTSDATITVELRHLEQQGFVRYEPAVPRCKTCRFRIFEHADDPHDEYWDCARNTFDDGINQDGLGYCSDHEARA